MQQRILMHGIDKLVLQQQVVVVQWPSDLSHPDSVAQRIASEGFHYRGWFKDRGETVLQFEDLDLRYWSSRASRSFEVHPSSEALTCRPLEAWELAQKVFQVMGFLFSFVPDPAVARLDLFIDVAGLRVCPGFIDRIRRRTGMKRERGEDWVAFGSPRRLYIYNKLRDALERPRKRFVLDLWRRQGWTEPTPVARLDLRFSKKELRRIGTGDLNALREDLLNRLVLMRRVHFASKGRSMLRTDGLWKAISTLDFKPPWDAPPSALRIPPQSLIERAHHATACVRWALATIIAIGDASPVALDPWASAVVRACCASPGVNTPEFHDLQRHYARGLHLPAGADIQARQSSPVTSRMPTRTPSVTPTPASMVASSSGVPA